MSFLTWAALAIGTLVVAPLVAHLLRRRPPVQRPFAGVALVPASPAVTKRRRAIEDRALFALRAAAVVALAVLGATPLLRCTRLAVTRQAGASVALAVVVDDSLSMRAPYAGSDGATRFERAREAAIELVEGLQSGDAVAVVLAGAPARVALAATTNLGAAREVLAEAAQTDRATDLDGAMAHAGDLLRELPHQDKRVLLLSDGLDGVDVDEPVQAPEGLTLWAPLPELRARHRNCGVLSADRTRGKIVVRLACARAAGTGEQSAPASSATGTASAAPRSAGSDRRVLAVLRGSTEIASTPVDLAAGTADIVVPLAENGRGVGARAAPSGSASAAAPAAGAAGGGKPTGPSGSSEAAGDTAQLQVVLQAADAIAADDRAPVIEPSGVLRVGVVADADASRPPTGGPPPVEQAFAALGRAGQLTLLTAVPDDEDALAELSVLVVDDAPGFTPEQRRRLAEWVERGGVLLLALGPNAGSARLGSGFGPMLPTVVRWSAWDRPADAAPAPSPDDKTPPAVPTASAGTPAAAAVTGIDLESDDLFGPTAEGLEELAPKGRARLDIGAVEGARVRARWSDGQAFLLERRSGRGMIFALTVPLGADQSDFVLRPAFLVLLQRLVDTALTLGGVSRSPVGTSWVLPSDGSVKVERLTPGGQPQAVAISGQGARRRLVPELLGRYRLVLDGVTTYRVAAVEEREVLVRQRPLAPGADDERLGGVTAHVDVSRHVALVLLLLLAAELAVRVATGRGAPKRSG